VIIKSTRFLLRKNKNDMDRSIRYIVSHAYNKVPFYRRTFNKAGVNPADIRKAEDLTHLPVTKRLDMMAAGHTEYLSHGLSPKKLVIRHTTGTTGTPITVYKNKMEELFRKITVVDSYRRNASLTCPMTLVNVGPERKDGSTKIVEKIGPITIIKLFRDIPMEKQISILMSVKPTIMGGRPSVYWDMANFLRDKGIVPHSPRLITGGAEVLLPHVRKLLEDVFRCRVADYYNSEEGGNLAWECPANPELMHPNTATVWIEAVDQQGIPVSTGSEGHLIITNLYNYSMPFIRYETGDRGILLETGKCQCGFNGPVMRLMEGRNENYIVLPDGREISPRIMFNVVNTGFPHDKKDWNMIDAMRTFQIIQESNDLIEIRVVPGPAYSNSLWRAVEENLKILHPAMRLKVAIVDDLRPEPGKKFHQVLGKLSSRWKRERNDYENK
jgi:phenylacetate-CoA ligase